MSIARAHRDDSRLADAARELQQAIAARYPDATFELVAGDDPPGLYLIPTVDVEDTEEVADIVADRVLDLQIEDGLPIYVFPVRPLARVLAERSSM